MLLSLAFVLGVVSNTADWQLYKSCIYISNTFLNSLKYWCNFYPFQSSSSTFDFFLNSNFVKQPKILWIVQCTTASSKCESEKAAEIWENFPDESGVKGGEMFLLLMNLLELRERLTESFFSFFHETFILLCTSGFFLVPIYCKGREDIHRVSGNSEWTLVLWTFHILCIRKDASACYFIYYEPSKRKIIAKEHIQSSREIK